MAKININHEILQFFEGYFLLLVLFNKLNKYSGLITEIVPNKPNNLNNHRADNIFLKFISFF